jgi:hypothetical protein
MKRTLIIPMALAAALAAGPAAAKCKVEYKAKQDNPLRLDYGTAELPNKACGSKEAAAEALAKKLKKEGWTLLAIVSILGSN